MNIAQQRIAAIGAWLAESSNQQPAPLSGLIAKGPFAVLVPAETSQSPADVLPGGFDAEALPLFIPQAQAPASLPTIDTTAPASQDRASDRLAHLLWKLDQGALPAVAVVPLESPETTLGAAITAAGMGGLDLSATALLCVPLWALPADARDSIARRLPRSP